MVEFRGQFSRIPPYRAAVSVVAVLFLLALPVSIAVFNVRGVARGAETDPDHSKRYQRAYELETKGDYQAALDEYEAALEGVLVEAERLSPGKERDSKSGVAGMYLNRYARLAPSFFRVKSVHVYAERLRRISDYGEAYSDIVLPATNLAAHAALGSKNYDEAIRLFGDLERMGAAHKSTGYFVKNYVPATYGRLARTARDVAARKLKPEYTARVLSLRVGSVRMKWRQGNLDASTSPYKLKKGDLELADLAENSLRETVLAMSDGKLDLSFERVALIEPFTITRAGAQNGPGNGDDIVDLMPGPRGDEVRAKVKESDFVILFWLGNNPIAQHAGARAFAIEGREYRRGNINIGVVFFHYRRSPGVIPTGIGGYPIVYLHEFFHVVEARFGIKPNHGFRPENRKSFPDWKGSDEVDYYAWQFRENIPRLFGIKRRKSDWSAFSYR